MKYWIAMAVLLTGCSRSDQQTAHEKMRETGQKLKKELHNDADFVKHEVKQSSDFMKEEARKARVETQKGVTEVKKKVNGDVKTLREKREENQ
ncbi:MAG TPA: hypothetical protein DEQ47_09545 [Solibacterales bacterium]|nr:hypothetical protein [Bryobacterales bacterium]